MGWESCERLRIMQEKYGGLTQCTNHIRPLYSQLSTEVAGGLADT